MHTTESSRNKSAGAIYLVWLPHLVNWLQSEEACISQLHTLISIHGTVFLFFFLVNFIQWQRERNLLEIAVNRTLQGKKMHKIYKWINWASIRYPRQLQMGTNCDWHPNTSSESFMLHKKMLFKGMRVWWFQVV